MATLREDLTQATKKGEPGKPLGSVQYYLNMISAYDAEFQKWEKRCEDIIKRYRDDGRAKRSSEQSKFNILWANVQTLVPATFSRLPQPDVSRRFRDNDPAGRVASLILERSLEFDVQHYSDYRATLKQDVFDRFLGGRGTAWIRYEPHFKAIEEGLPEDGVGISEDVEKPNEELDYECAPIDYVHWKDFGHAIARTWEEVPVVWRKVFMTREAAVERFGEEIGNALPLDTKPEEKKLLGGASPDDKQYRALVYEVWDKEEEKAYWISKNKTDPLDERDDPLGLSEFFPCPRPLFATLTNETLVPVPDFVLYQDQARQLDTLSDRIDGLIKALQVKGCYDDSIPELKRLFTEGVNGTLIPVKNYAAFAEKHGLAGGLDLVDLKPIYEALREAYLAFEQIIGQIYQIMGISDIVRGQTNPNETLGAQELKGQYVGLRLSDMKNAVAQFATEILQLKAQVYCAKFSPETLLRMSAVDQLAPVDQQLIPQAMAILLGNRAQDPSAEEGPNPIRAFRIEVAADSLVQLDEQAEKDSRLEFLKASSTFIEGTAQALAKMAPPVASALAPLLLDMLKYGVTAFKVGKTIEGSFDEAADKLKQFAAQPQPPAPPDPSIVKAQMDAQAKAQQVQADQAQEAARMQMEERLKMQDLQFQDQMAQREQALKNDFERWKTQLQEDTKVIVAEIAAKASVKTTAMSANAANADAPTQLNEETGIQEPSPTLSTIINDIHANLESLVTQRVGGMASAADEHYRQMQAIAKAPRRIVRGPDGRATGAEIAMPQGSIQ